MDQQLSLQLKDEDEMEIDSGHHTFVTVADDGLFLQSPGSTNSYFVTQGALTNEAPKAKKVKQQEADSAVSEDDNINIDEYVHVDPQKLNVKLLRKLVPKLRIKCYMNEQDVSGKRKIKHLWDDKPVDWPSAVPFKDPNNSSSAAKKPGKEDLNRMFKFLSQKYLNNTRTQMPFSPARGVNGLSLVDQPQETNDEQATFTAMQPVMFVNYDKGFVPSSNEVKPTGPVETLQQRVFSKIPEVVARASDQYQQEIQQMLNAIASGVIGVLFNKIDTTDVSEKNRNVLMFLDAGHQFEALLDVMLVLPQLNAELLKSGCEEIQKKFAAEIQQVFYSQQNGNKYTIVYSQSAGNNTYGGLPNELNIRPRTSNLDMSTLDNYTPRHHDSPMLSLLEEPDNKAKELYDGMFDMMEQMPDIEEVVEEKPAEGSMHASNLQLEDGAQLLSISNDFMDDLMNVIQQDDTNSVVSYNTTDQGAFSAFSLDSFTAGFDITSSVQLNQQQDTPNLPVAVAETDMDSFEKEVSRPNKGRRAAKRAFKRRDPAT